MIIFVLGKGMVLKENLVAEQRMLFTGCSTELLLSWVVDLPNSQSCLCSLVL